MRTFFNRLYCKNGISDYPEHVFKEESEHVKSCRCQEWS